MDRGALLTLQMKEDNWQVVDEMDNWLFVFDRMPRKMKIVVDLKITGMSNKDIAKELHCTVCNVCNHLLKAKKRLLRGENIL